MKCIGISDRAMRPQPMPNAYKLAKFRHEIASVYVCIICVSIRIHTILIRTTTTAAMLFAGSLTVCRALLAEEQSIGMERNVEARVRRTRIQADEIMIITYNLNPEPALLLHMGH